MGYTVFMKIREGISLKEYSTYAIGGRAGYFCEIENEEGGKEAIEFANDNHLQIFVLGGGSNLIISDSGFNGLVLKVNVSRYTLHATRLTVGAGVSMQELVEKTTSQGLGGLEWAGGLPGSIGGAIFGNAGCFGHEIKEIIQNVHAIDFEGNIRDFSKEQCGFFYRSSIFKREEGWIILEAELAFEKGEIQELQKIAQEKIDYRKARHPVEYPNIGSIFKNIEDQASVKKILERLPELENDVRARWYGKVPTAVLIEKVGLKGKRDDGIQVSEKHANFLINTGGGKAQVVADLIKEIKQKVKEQFDIELEEEVRYIGFD